MKLELQYRDYTQFLGSTIRYNQKKVMIEADNLNDAVKEAGKKWRAIVRGDSFSAKQAKLVIQGSDDEFEKIRIDVIDRMFDKKKKKKVTNKK